MGAINNETLCPFLQAHGQDCLLATQGAWDHAIILQRRVNDSCLLGHAGVSCRVESGVHEVALRHELSDNQI